MFEYIARVTVNAMAAGRFVALVKGERVLLAPEEADDLLRVQYVEPAPEATGKAAAVETAAFEPEETATAPTQESKRRKGTAA